MLRLVVRQTILLALMAGLLAGSLTATAAPPGQESSPVTLTVAMPAPTNLDPVQLSRFDPHARDLVENLFIGLTRFNPTTQDIEPMLAKSWSVSEDGLTWTFELRDDIQWVRYDRATQEVVAVRPVVAGDFVYAIQRACDPLRPSPVTANIMIIDGCQTVANAFPEVINDLFIAREVGVRATGPTTLEMDLVFPSGYLPTLLSMPEFRPLAREAITEGTNWAAADTLLTNGPYVLAGWESSGLTLERNPFWPDGFAGNVEQVEVHFTTENDTAATLVASARADMARLAPEEIAAASPDLLHTAPGSSLVMLGFSYDRALVNTAEVRRALAYALDRAALVNQLFPGQAEAVSQLTPPGVVAEPAFNGFTFNAIQAQNDLGAAGYAGCANWPEPLIVLMPDDAPVWNDLGTAITAQWSAQLGCNPALFEVRLLPRTLLIELAHSAYDPTTVTRSHIWLAVWSADYLDANAWIGDALHCQYGYIKTGRECDAADALLDQAAVEMDPQRRADLYAQVEAHFFGPQGTFPVIPLYRTVAAWLQQPWLSGVNEYGPARYDLWTLDTAARSGA